MQINIIAKATHFVRVHGAGIEPFIDCALCLYRPCIGIRSSLDAIADVFSLAAYLISPVAGRQLDDPILTKIGIRVRYMCSKGLCVVLNQRKIVLDFGGDMPFCLGT